MLKLLMTLARGAAADAEEAVFDTNAVKVLEQQVRDSATGLERTRHALALAIAQREAEARRIANLQDRVADFEVSAVDALRGGRDDLAEEAAAIIAQLTDEIASRQQSIDATANSFIRLKQLLSDGERRLVDVKRGLEAARVQQCLARAGADGRVATASTTAALRDAEATLSRLQDRAIETAFAAEALDALEQESSGSGLRDRMSAAGFGDAPKTRTTDVLNALRARATKTNASPEQEKAPPQ